MIGATGVRQHRDLHRLRLEPTQIRTSGVPLAGLVAGAMQQVRLLHQDQLPQLLLLMDGVQVRQHQAPVLRLLLTRLLVHMAMHGADSPGFPEPMAVSTGGKSLTEDLHKHRLPMPGVVVGQDGGQQLKLLPFSRTIQFYSRPLCQRTCSSNTRNYARPILIILEIANSCTWWCMKERVGMLRICLLDFQTRYTKEILKDPDQTVFSKPGHSI